MVAQSKHSVLPVPVGLSSKACVPSEPPSRIDQERAKAQSPLSNDIPAERLETRVPQAHNREWFLLHTRCDVCGQRNNVEDMLNCEAHAMRSCLSAGLR
mgnify:CR=1 FL=1